MRRRTILVADEDRPTRDAVRLRLEAAGFLVLGVGEWDGMLEMVRRDHPHLLVLDVGVAAGLGSRGHGHPAHVPELSRMPVIHVTAESPESIGCEAIAGGAWCVLHKPFRGIELVEACRTALETWRPADAG